MRSKGVRRSKEKVQVLGSSEVSLEALVKESLRLIGQEERIDRRSARYRKVLLRNGRDPRYHFHDALSDARSWIEKESLSGVSYHLPAWGRYFGLRPLR